MDERKDTTCYGIGCDNHATTELKLSLNTQLSCTIYVCDHCLPKFLSDHHVQKNKQATPRGELEIA